MGIDNGKRKKKKCPKYQKSTHKSHALMVFPHYKNPKAMCATVAATTIAFSSKPQSQKHTKVDALQTQTQTQTQSDESNRSPSLPHQTATIFPSTKRIMLAAAAAASSSSSTWLRARPIRYLVLLLCSPILLPFLCAVFPLLCAAELCLRLCRRRRSRKISDRSEEDDERLRRCEEGHCGSAEPGGEEVGILLLQRYLEDQFLLVGSMYDCGDDAELEEDFGATEDQSSARAPLLN